MRERVEHYAVQTITLKKADIKWVDDGEELLVENKLFDVKSYTNTEGQTTFTGLFDEEEDNIIATLNNNFQQKKDSNNLLVIKFIAEQVLSNNEVSFTIQNCWKIINPTYPSFLQVMPQITCSITIPPPKFS